MFKKYISMIKSFIKSKKWIALLILCIIPLAYVGCYVGVYQNVDKNTKDFKVGVLLEDQGYKNQNFSKKFKDNLASNKDISWKFYSKKSLAMNELDKYGSIYLLIDLGPDFTKNIVRIKDNYEVTTLNLDIYQNPKKNGMINSVSQSLKSKIRNTLKEEIIKTASQIMKDKTKGLDKKVDTAENGLKKLKSGTKLLSSSLKSAQAILNSKENFFDEQKNNFEKSYLFNLLPNLKNINNKISKIKKIVLSNNTDLDIENIDLLEPYVNNLYKVNNASNDQVRLIKNEITNLIQIHDDILQIKNNANWLTNELDINSKIQIIKQRLNDNTILNKLNQKISDNKYLSKIFKSNLIDFNNKIKHFKNNVLIVIESFGEISSIFKNDIIEIKNIIQIPTIKKLQSFLGIDFSTFDEISKTFSVSRVNDYENGLTSDVQNIVEKSKSTDTDMSKIRDGVNIIIGNINFNKIHDQSFDYVDSTISPIKVKSNDINPTNQIFGVVFVPMTICIGIWFLMIFFFTATVKTSEFKKDILANILFKNTLAVFLTTFSFLIVYLVLIAEGVKIISPLWMWITMVSYSFAISNVFLIVYYYLNDFARYIFTILLVVNITSSEATYPIETLFPIFKQLFAFTPFRYAIVSLRETFSKIIDYNTCITNINILMLIGVCSIIINILISKLIIKKI